MRMVFQALYVCRKESGTQCMIKLSVSKKKNVHFYIIILCPFKCWKYCFLGLRLPPNPPIALETSQTCQPTPHFARILPNIQYFPNHWSTQFFYIGDRSWYSDERVWRFHYILYWVAWVLLIFVLRKNKYSNKYTFISLYIIFFFA